MNKSNHAPACNGLHIASETDGQKEYLIPHDGAYYAGHHVLLDIWNGKHLDNIQMIDSALRSGANEAGATLLHLHLHQFNANGGVSGVAVLAESHISIHTWPEWNYAAVDVFMCGETNPMKTAEVIKNAFKPDCINITEHYRGRVR